MSPRKREKAVQGREKMRGRARAGPVATLLTGLPASSPGGSKGRQRGRSGQRREARVPPWSDDAGQIQKIHM